MRHIDEIKYVTPYIIIMKVSPIDPTMQDIEDTLKFFETQFEKKGMVLITDISRAKFMKSEHRIKIGNWLKANQSRIKEHWAGIGTINTNVLALIMLKGIFAVTPSPVSHTVVGSEAAAIEWANRMISNFGTK